MRHFYSFRVRRTSFEAPQNPAPAAFVGKGAQGNGRNSRRRRKWIRANFAATLSRFGLCVWLGRFRSVKINCTEPVFVLPLRSKRPYAPILHASCQNKAQVEQSVISTSTTVQSAPVSVQMDQPAAGGAGGEIVPGILLPLSTKHR